MLHRQRSHHMLRPSLHRSGRACRRALLLSHRRTGDTTVGSANPLDSFLAMIILSSLTLTTTRRNPCLKTIMPNQLLRRPSSTFTIANGMVDMSITMTLLLASRTSVCRLPFHMHNPSIQDMRRRISLLAFHLLSLLLSLYSRYHVT